MTRKSLPKAITRARDELREISAGSAGQLRKKPAGKSVAAPPPDEEASLPERASHQSDASVAELAPSVSSPPIAGELPRADSIQSEMRSPGRRADARKIVERYKLYAAVGGLLPLPIVNVAGVTAIIMRMVRALCTHYGAPFEQDRARTIVMGLMGGAVPTGLGVATASTLAFIVPGSTLVGLAVSSVTAAAFTRGIGFVFIEHFEGLSGSVGSSNVKTDT